MRGQVRYFAQPFELYDDFDQFTKTLVRVYQSARDPRFQRQVGTYFRSNHQFYNTFYHVHKEGKDYALFVPDDFVRIMLLPECRVIGGETEHPQLPVPVEFHSLPDLPDLVFLSGYIPSHEMLRLQIVDISKIEEGILVRSDPFGFYFLPFNLSLKDAIQVSGASSEGSVQVEIATTRTHLLRADGSVVTNDFWRE